MHIIRRILYLFVLPIKKENKMFSQVLEYFQCDVNIFSLPQFYFHTWKTELDTRSN